MPSARNARDPHLRDHSPASARSARGIAHFGSERTRGAGRYYNGPGSGDHRAPARGWCQIRRSGTRWLERRRGYNGERRGLAAGAGYPGPSR